MKKFIPFVFFTLMAMNATPVWADKSTAEKEEETVSATESKANESKLSEEEIKCMNERLIEIRDMDKSKLTADQKRELRKEVRDIRDDLKKNHAVIIIPVCTLIIILLLILLI